jgi:serine protease Do
MGKANLFFTHPVFSKEFFMRPFLYPVVCGVCFVSVAFPAHAQLFGKTEKTEPRVEVPAPRGAPQSFADLAQKLLPSVVNISSTQKVAEPDSQDMPQLPEFPPGSPFEDFFKDFLEKRGQALPDSGPAIPAASLGSGFIIDAEKGYIVTNNHVIRDAEEVRVTLHDDTTLDAKIIGKDEKMDLAVLQVKSDKKLTAITFGDSDQMRVGDWILAIGNPFGLGGTVTSGIISARQRDIQSGPYDDYLQTDASINRGNSGGPMFNLKGEVIGINTAIFSPSGGSVGIGFAIPSNLAKPVVDQLIKFGKTRRGWLGIRIQTVTKEIADSLGLGDVRGALVASLTEGGPAEKAGLQQGDVILEFNGQKLDAMRALPRLVAETEIGSTATILYWRNGKTFTTKVVVGELEKAEEKGLIEKAESGAALPKGVVIPDLGVTAMTLTTALRNQFEIPDKAQGVLVTDVAANSQAAEENLMVGDVIVEINQQAVKDADSAKKVVEDAKKAGKTSVLLLVDNQGKGDVRFVAIRFKNPSAKLDKENPPARSENIE